MGIPGSPVGKELPWSPVISGAVMRPARSELSKFPAGCGPGAGGVESRWFWASCVIIFSSVSIRSQSASVVAPLIFVAFGVCGAVVIVFPLFFVLPFALEDSAPLGLLVWLVLAVAPLPALLVESISSLIQQRRKCLSRCHAQRNGKSVIKGRNEVLKISDLKLGFSIKMALLTKLSTWTFSRALAGSHCDVISQRHYVIK